ncbi:hypothetical protein PUMCH_004201 [Australozyma saopauloensis]|uniref:Uncharacterized protein n=1 Tax=Australozyma saopauloensis TaxID=291208 RepID=A0AAX4HEP3_9ASCO|nr:hypothetical protein PUMCH_004201 [[Candida] saopauloensis]
MPMASRSHTKQLVLVMICLNQIYDGLAIRLLNTETQEIHVMANLSLFQLRIKLLLEKKTYSGVPTIIVVNRDILVTIRNLKFLTQNVLKNISGKRSEDSTRDISLSDSLLDSKQINASSKTEQCNANLIVVNDLSSQSEHSIVSASQIALQQLLRFLAMYHNGAFASIFGLRQLVSDPLKIAKFTATVTGPENQPILEFDDPEEDSFELYQNLSSGWDTLTKILLVARSVPYLPEGSCLTEELEIDELKTVYTRWLETSSIQDESMYTQLRKYGLLKDDEIPSNSEIAPPVPITFQKFVESFKST